MNKYLEKIAEISAMDWHVRGQGDMPIKKERLEAMGIGAGAAMLGPAYNTGAHLINGGFKGSTVKDFVKGIPRAARIAGTFAGVGAGIGLAAHTLSSELERRKMNNAVHQYE